MNKTRILKIGLPVGIGLVTASLAWAGVGQEPTATMRTEATSTTQPDANVTVNGQSVNVPAGGSQTIQTGDTTATVSVSKSQSGSGATTSVSNANGNVNITVTSDSKNTSSFSNTSVSSFSSNHSGQNSSIQVNTNGTGNVSISK